MTEDTKAANKASCEAGRPKRLAALEAAERLELWVHFAGHALAGLVAYSGAPVDAARLAEDASAIAHAMLAEYDRRKA